MNVAMLLEMAAEGMGDRVALGRMADGITYAELLDRAQRTATVVRQTGAERIGLLDQNSEVVPQLLFASAIAGVPFAPVNYRLADDRLSAVAARLAPALVVADAGAFGRIGDVAGLTVVRRDELLGRMDGAEPATDAHTDPEQVAVWLFTSGTTGEPKAALLRHRHLVSYVLSTVDFQ
jgi:fatty-acyl-CoA synthase